MSKSTAPKAIDLLEDPPSDEVLEVGTPVEIAEREVLAAVKVLADLGQHAGPGELAAVIAAHKKLALARGE
jgi:hypothetical protein